MGQDLGLILPRICGRGEIGFEGSGLALAVIAVLTLANALGASFSDTAWFKIVVILVVAAIQIYLPTLGRTVIMAFQKVLAWALIRT